MEIVVILINKCAKEKGGEAVSSLAEELMHELTAETAFTIPVFGGIPVAESVVVTWIIMAALMVLVFLMTRNLKVHNISRRQAALETFVDFIQNLTGGFVGEHGGAFVPYLSTIIIYIAIANAVGIFGFKPPTKDLNVTAALAIMSIILVEGACIRYRGPKGFLKSFAEPAPVMVPIKIMELVTRPLSLCMRLFGNILGAFAVMKLAEAAMPAIFPAFCSLYFDFFDGAIQAYVFVFLTGMFIKESIE
jgi:F-type H+-transporting ATPase subunit a